MPKRIEIRGVIVPSALDSSWTREWVDKGVFTPESRVRAAFKDAGKEPVELYINSPGGSVFAGYEMANAANEYLAAGGQIEITLGALAASAAANIVAAVPAAKVRAHANTKIMYHGAAGYTEGGAEAHADTAELLAKVNAEVQKALTTRYKLAAETVAGWFAEGRQGWLTAAEAQAAGLVDEIIENAAPLLKFRAADAAQFAEHGIAIAALAVEDDPPAAGTEPQQAATPPEKPAEPAKPADPVQEPAAVLEARLALAEAVAAHKAEAAETARLHAEAIAKRDAQIAAHQSRADKAEAALAKAQADAAAAATAHAAELDALRAEHATRIAELTARLDRLTGGLRYAEDAAVGTWAEALDACQGDYVEARRKYPAVYAAFMQATRKPRN